jgi:inosine-uridine nucleoside N-ribohydrolase
MWVGVAAAARGTCTSVESWTGKDTKRARFLRAILGAVMRREMAKGQRFIACDPVAAAAAVEPSLVTRTRTVLCHVELQGTTTRGMSVVWEPSLASWGGDHLKAVRASGTVDVVEAFDLVRFCALMERATD